STLRIVLWDTTLERLNEEQILFIVAHEIGHYVMRHLEWSAVGAIGSSLVMLWLGSRMFHYAIHRWGRQWGIRRAHSPAALPLLLLLISLLGFAATPVTNAVSRQAEHAADRYALELRKENADAAVQMYQQLARASLSDVNPPL